MESTEEKSETDVPRMKQMRIVEVHNGWVIEPSGYGAQAVVVERLKGRDNMAVLLAQVAAALGDAEEHAAREAEKRTGDGVQKG